MDYRLVQKAADINPVVAHDYDGYNNQHDQFDETLTSLLIFTFFGYSHADFIVVADIPSGLDKQ